MSIPISPCMFAKAFDEDEFDQLVEILVGNRKGGHFLLCPCHHAPPCRDLTEEEVDLLDEAVNAAMGLMPNEVHVNGELPQDIVGDVADQVRSNFKKRRKP